MSPVAAVGFQTEKIIQETIRSEFKDKSTLASLLIELAPFWIRTRFWFSDHGNITEFDSPGALLKNKEIIFYPLGKKGGYIS